MKIKLFLLIIIDYLYFIRTGYIYICLSNVHFFKTAAPKVETDDHHRFYDKAYYFGLWNTVFFFSSLKINDKI